MNTLYVTTSDQLKTEVIIKKDTTEFRKAHADTSLRRSQVTLALIQQLLEESGLSIGEINALEVDRGPGSFTGVRVGVSIVNALSFCLGIPVNKKKISEVELPIYPS